MRTGDLGVTARLALVGGVEALESVRFEVLRPVMPMLAGSSEDVTAALAATGLASVEWKLDGARVQVHRSGSEVRMFTRNLNDVTARLPEVVELARGFPSTEFVLDGETIGVSDDERPERFQDTMSRFGRDQIENAPALQAFFFDCLRADGVDLLDEPLEERRAVLQRCARAGRAVVGDRRPRGRRRVPRRGARRGARRCDGEGVVVDLRGRPPGHGVAQGEAGPHPRSRRARGRVGPRPAAGLAVEPAPRRATRGTTLRDGGQDVQGAHRRAPHLADRAAPGARTSTDGHVVLVRPELVVEIALDGVQASKRYPGGVALRFARVRGYRPDKSPPTPTPSTRSARCCPLTSSTERCTPNWSYRSLRRSFFCFLIIF